MSGRNKDICIGVAIAVGIILLIVLFCKLGAVLLGGKIYNVEYLQYEVVDNKCYLEVGFEDKKMRKEMDQWNDLEKMFFIMEDGYIVNGGYDLKVVVNGNSFNIITKNKQVIKRC